MKGRINLLVISLIVLLIIAIAPSVNASVGHDDDHMEIDISSGYTSSDIILKWGEEKTFSFEITTLEFETTFEILDLNGSLFEYRFEHEHNISTNETHLMYNLEHLSHENDSVDDSYWITSEGLPMGTHLDGHVVRHITFDETGNFSLEISNAHDHPESSVKFSIKFSTGHIGTENMGASWNDSGDQAATPGFEFIPLFLALIVLPLILKRKKQSN